MTAPTFDYGNLLSSQARGSYRAQKSDPRDAFGSQNWSGLAGQSSASKANVEGTQISTTYGLAGQGVQASAQVASQALAAASNLSQAGLSAAVESDKAKKALQLENAKRGDRMLYMGLGTAAAAAKLAWPKPKHSPSNLGGTEYQPLPGIGTGGTAGDAGGSDSAGKVETVDLVAGYAGTAPDADSVVSGYADAFGKASLKQDWSKLATAGMDFSKYHPSNVSTDGNLFEDKGNTQVLQSFTFPAETTAPIQPPQVAQQPKPVPAPSTPTAEGAIGDQLNRRRKPNGSAV